MKTQQVPECAESQFLEAVDAALGDHSLTDAQLVGVVELRRAQYGLSWEEARLALGVSASSQV